MAKAPELKLKEGDPAPHFTTTTYTGERVSLADLKGRHVVLYFYPRDNTPGCTREACGFRDHHSSFGMLKAVVLGVSVDSAKSHERFANRYALPFPLMMDEDHKIVRAYGVWGRKKFMGRTYDGTHRVTFLIGPDGRIRRIWTEVKPDAHAAEVLAAIGP
jgi:peroxiredoxin Q/BCP